MMQKQHPDCPDDNLPEYICCDCIEEIIETENIGEVCKAALKYLVSRNRLLKYLEYSLEKERSKESPSHLTLSKYLTEHQSNGGDYVCEAPGNNSFSLLSSNKIKISYQCDTFKRNSESGIKSNTNMENSVDSGVHQCCFCRGVFFNVEELSRHEYLFHNDHSSFCCGKCHKKFKTPRSLDRHIEKHNFMCKYKQRPTGEEIIEDHSVNVCILSSEPSISENGESCVRKSKISLKKNIRYNCGKCDNYFESSMELKAHLKETHSSLSPCICGLCNTGFLSKYEVELHKYVHPKQFTCDVCNLSFFASSSYNRHIKYCKEKVVNFRCQFCGKEASNKWNLKLHLHSHSQTNKFECQICRKSFSRSENAQVHIRSVHLKLKPHECGVCQKSFSSRTILKMHLTAHSGEKVFFPCSVCDKKYKRYNSKWKHEKFFHGLVKSQDKYIVAEELLQKAFLGDV